MWLAAGWYARAYLADDPERQRFRAFFLATQAGNLGVCLAQDAASFYLFFALMTFAAYGLVVHAGSGEARRAARVYLAMAVLGEALLLSGLFLAVAGAGGHGLAALAAAPASAAAVAPLLAGFGVKAGVPLLHLWLPLAHPVAPVPASAVLSGVIIKAGLLGWLRFLPLGSREYPEAGVVLMAAGLLGMFGGVAAGLAQRDPKVLLAYSSISQMGFMSLAIGAGLAAPGLWPVLLPAVLLYAAHHALAKSALFLGVGVARVRGGRRPVLAGLLLPALALAGAPFTSGALAKLELKYALAAMPSPWAGMLPPLLWLAAVGTALLMIRLLLLVAATPGQSSAHGGGKGLAAPWWALLLAGLVLPWWLSSKPAGALAAGALVDAVWPLAPALILAVLARRRGWRAPAIPPGDLLPLLETGLARARERLRERRRRTSPAPPAGTAPEAGRLPP